MKTYKINPWGREYDVAFYIEKYSNNGGLAIGVQYFDEEWGCWLPYATMTVNLGRVGNGFAYVDTNNCHWAEKLIARSGIGQYTGKNRVSGWCTYPLYEFNMTKLEAIAA